MSWISELFTSSVATIVEKAGEAIDANITNDEERLSLRNELARIQAGAMIASKELDMKYESEISGRHTSDMQSDDIWSKRIRPVSMAFLLGVVSFLAITDGNLTLWGSTIVIQEAYIDLFRLLLLTAFAFYFGGRSMEKIQKIKNNREAK